MAQACRPVHIVVITSAAMRTPPPTALSQWRSGIARRSERRTERWYNGYPAVLRFREMWRLAPFVLIVATVSAQQPSQPGREEGGERDFLSRIRRLTVEGRRAGEGYWAPDGQR